MPDTTTLLTALLDAGDSGFVSGEELARRLGISRVSVWARLQKLQAEGLACEAVRGRGYRLSAEPTALHPAVLAAYVRLRHRAKTPPGVEVIYLPEIDSTNLEAERRLAAGARAPFVVFAARQTAGRGRLGRAWHSAETGGLYLSFAFRPQLPPARMPKFTLWMALRLCRMLNETYHLPVGVKWPNDLVHDGRKLAGLLTEARMDADLMRELICGLGLNVNGDPAKWSGGSRGTASAAAKVGSTLQQVNHGIALPLNAVAADVVLTGTKAYTDFIAGRSDAEFDELWSRFDTLRNREITVSLPTGPIKGRASGLDPSGALRLALPSGEIRLIQSGDVSLGGYG
ncbi:MAG TPA: biotin--[acetyl-CoA-carboxylase] ligase [Opitutales bacterium]|jgi:BirA family biotin operon repressor/biotin-[acetyl-CoA-carboxylase] ligase|nr:biotin--[acetyl-CoA-carboxylase] ligase [Opitutales bacterium]